MYRGSVATMWHAADEEGKLRMLRNASRHDCPISVELVDDEVDVLDALAAQVGIKETRVDAAGLRYPADAVVGAEYAGNYHRRSLRVPRPAD